jgi:predicted  nucleic acid-binding Zn-ribbon protein
LLQRTDTQLALKQRRYRQVQASLGESETLSNARSALKTTQDDLSRQRAILLDRELEAGSVTAKLKANEQRLYGGKVTNPRELSDLQKENEYLQRHSADLEDKQIEAMMTVEQVTEQVAVANEHHVVVEAAWRKENAELSQEYDTLRHELAQLLAQRKKILKLVSKNDLIEYDTIRRRRKGIAVVAVKNDICQVCHVQVPQRDLNRAQQTEDIFYCSGCERIIYVPQDS